jgi:ferric-dicitrate binding protein FerR (iron transport regulator)
MDDRIQKLENDIQNAKEKQREMTKDITCILKTWDDFTNEYLPYLKLLAEREKERAELRRAVIKHGTIVALGAVILFVLNAVSHELQALFRVIPK